MGRVERGDVRWGGWGEGGCEMGRVGEGGRGWERVGVRWGGWEEGGCEMRRVGEGGRGWV